MARQGSAKPRDEQPLAKRPWEKPQVLDLTLQATGAGNGQPCVSGSGNATGCGAGTLGIDG